MMNIPFRNDEYGKKIYIESDNKFVLIPYDTGNYKSNGIDFSVAEKIEGNILNISISINYFENCCKQNCYKLL